MKPSALLRSSLLSLFALTGSIALAGPATPASESAPDKSGYHLFNPVPANLLRELATDRPDQTEGPGTIDAGHLQLEMDLANATFDRHSPDGVRTESWSIAPLNIRIGLLTNLEFDIILDNYVLERTKEPGARHYDRTSGFGDITVRFKYNFWGNDGGTTAFGVIPFVKLPLDESNLRNGKTEGGLILPLSINLPGDWELGMMTEWDFVSDGGSGYDHEFVNSITASHAIVGKLNGYVEFFSVVGTARGFDWIGQADVGLTWAVTDNLQFDCGCNFGVTKAAPDYNPFVGVSVRF